MKTFYKVFRVELDKSPYWALRDKRNNLYNLSWETGKVHVVGGEYENYRTAKIVFYDYEKAKRYASGFHGFATKIAAEAWVIDMKGVSGHTGKVFKCRGLVRTEGYQIIYSKNKSYKVVVADTMEIICEV